MPPSGFNEKHFDLPLDQALLSPSNRGAHKIEMREKAGKDATTNNELRALACVKMLFESACLCNNAQISSSTPDSTTGIGQPTEVALLEAARRLSLPDPRADPRLERVREVPFSSERKLMEVRYLESHSKGSGGGGGVPLKSVFGSESVASSHVKGALEAVLPRCGYMVAADGSELVLDDATRARVQEEERKMARDGLRVLAIARGRSAFNVKVAVAVGDEGEGEGERSPMSISELALCGIVGMMDPLRDGVIEAVNCIQRSGVRVVMITGDSKPTAGATPCDISHLIYPFLLLLLLLLLFVCSGDRSSGWDKKAHGDRKWLY